MALFNAAKCEAEGWWVFWNFFLNPLATLDTIAHTHIMCVLGECECPGCYKCNKYARCCIFLNEKNISTWSVIMPLINFSNSTIALPGVEISGAQNSIFQPVLSVLSDLPKPTHIFSIFNSGGCGHAAVGRHFILKQKKQANDGLVLLQDVAEKVTSPSRSRTKTCWCCHYLVTNTGH